MPSVLKAAGRKKGLILKRAIMPNGQKKSGKSAHANKQRAKEREEMNDKINTITKDYEDRLGFIETRSKELTEEIAKTKKEMIKKNEEIKNKLSKSREQVEELQTDLIEQINENCKIMEQNNRYEEYAQNQIKEMDDFKKMVVETDWENMMPENIGDEMVKIITTIFKVDMNGEDIKEEEKKMCVLCENELDCPYGHNGAPICIGRVCDKCNKEKVIQFRMLITAVLGKNIGEEMNMKETEITKEEFEKAMKDPNVDIIGIKRE